MKKRVGGTVVSAELAVLVIAVVAAFVGLASPPGAWAQEALVIKALNEKRVTQLPAGPLYWRVETFPTLEAAQAAAEPTAMVVESAGRIWLVTLGPAGGSSPAAPQSPRLVRCRWCRHPSTCCASTRHPEHRAA